MTALLKYPFAEMEIGDTFLVPADSVKPGSFRTYTSQKARQLGRHFSVTRTADGQFYEVERIAQPRFSAAVLELRRTSDATATPKAGPPVKAVQRSGDDFREVFEGWVNRLR